MEVVQFSAETNKRRETFLRLLFEGGKGYFCIAYSPKDRDPKKFREEFFSFPDEIDLALNLVNEIVHDHNVWFCPHLFDKRRRKKENVAFTPCAWSDLDTCDPDIPFVTPTITIETSVGRYAGLWMFSEPIDPDVAENISHRIAYAHADEGADRSGWDLTQLLRFPTTSNLKYATTPTVKIIEINRNKYTLADFNEHYEEIANFIYVDQEMPDISMINADELLDKQRFTLTPTIWRLYQEPLAPDASWSEPLWKLMMYLFEAGFPPEQVFAIAKEAACNKYEKRGAPLGQLWKDVCRAKAKYDQSTDPIVQKENDTVVLLSPPEREWLRTAPETFIERYISWARELGDAAPQYHQAGAFTALSSLLSGSVELPTSFGTIKPNLWFMILADTTLTRKSTAMDIAMDLVGEVDDDAILATDGSIEGLLTSLSTRPGRPSVFLRDEFSGLLEMMTKRDYYAGMPELLTKLYDGKMQKRILRKESIDVRDPCLLVFAGGIKNKITGLLTFEHVSSGFMPRFVFITAESDITKVRPLGPPTDVTDNNRKAILEELNRLHSFYNQTVIMNVKGTSIKFEEHQKVKAHLTPEAWMRYNQMEEQMLQAGIDSERPEIMTPVYDRLSKSILKAAVLLSASRELQDELTVEVSDLVRAISYGEGWRIFVQEVMDNVGKGTQERQLDSIFRAISNSPGITRSSIMQSYHLNARTMSATVETLEQRGLINKQKQGRGECYFPNVIKVKEKVND